MITQKLNCKQLKAVSIRETSLSEVTLRISVSTDNLNGIQNGEK